MDYHSAMSIPVPYRKWLIKRWVEQKAKENNKNVRDVNEPLSETEKQKVKNSAKAVNPTFPAMGMNHK